MPEIDSKPPVMPTGPLSNEVDEIMARRERRDEFRHSTEGMIAQGSRTIEKINLENATKANLAAIAAPDKVSHIDIFGLTIAKISTFLKK
jgi:hypothetical protein